MHSELDRIRLLQNRMRNRSHNGTHPPPNDSSLRSIKSTDSKKIVPQNRLLEERNNGEDKASSHNSCLNDIQLHPPQLKNNHKITDFFPLFKIKKTTPPPPPPPLAPQPPLPPQEHPLSIPLPPSMKNELQSLKEQNNRLKETIDLKDSLTSSLKEDIIRMTIQTHKIKKNELRLRMNANKLRLGQYYADKKGRQAWIDGLQIREVKNRLQCITKEKQQIQKCKKSGKKVVRELNEDPQDWKHAIISHSYFLSREETAYQQTLKRLEQEKSTHIKECKMLFEEQHSKYGRLQARSEGWKKIHKYQLLGLIGKGGFSEVYKAFDTEQLREVACKVHQFHAGWEKNARDNYARHANRENHVHRQLMHPNIVRLLDAVQIDATSFCTIMEYCDGPDLALYLKRHKKLPEKEAKIIIRQVIQAIKYLHELPDKVIHYDLKPQNILFHKGRIKITDFGLCKTTREDFLELTSQGVGTYWYLPPECFEMVKVMITPKVDIWSIGVIFFEMLFGEKPFGNQMSQMRILQEGIMLKANTVNFPPAQKSNVSNQSKDFIKECLQFKPDLRIDIQTALSHKIFDRK